LPDRLSFGQILWTCLRWRLSAAPTFAKATVGAGFLLADGSVACLK
jgi:hypothetical protein